MDRKVDDFLKVKSYIQKRILQTNRIAHIFMKLIPSNRSVMKIAVLYLIMEQK